MAQKQSAFPSTRLRSVAALVLFTFGLASAASADTGKFSLSSPDLANGKFDIKHVLGAFGCSGSNISPELVWKNAPAGTKSFALQMYDPDAPTGSGFWHWTVYNIPATATGLPQGAGNAATGLPAPAYGGNTDFMDTGATQVNGNYGGPCPPEGDKPHRYVFTLYALGVDDLQKAGQLPKTGSAAVYSFVLNKGLGKQLLGKASFTAHYGR